MSNEIEQRNSDAYSITPFNFFEDFGRNLFNSFNPNLIRTDIHEADNEYFVDGYILIK